MAYRPNRRTVAFRLMADCPSNPQSQPQKLYGNLGDKVMKLVDGGVCEVELLTSMTVGVSEDKVVSAIPKCWRSSNFGYLAIPRGEMRYDVTIYKVTPIPDSDS